MAVALAATVGVGESLRRPASMSLVTPSVSASQLGAARVTPVVNGATAGETMPASSLWSDAGAVVFVVRRPG